MSGLTQCAPGRRGIIAPVPLHPVLEVKVVPGQRVKKGQDSSFWTTTKRGPTCGSSGAARHARQSAGEARRFRKGRVGPGNHARATAVRRALPSAKPRRMSGGQGRAHLADAELEHFHVTATVDGIVSRLDVCPGVVARPERPFGRDRRPPRARRTIDLSPEQADHVAVGQKVEVRTTDGGSAAGRRDHLIGPVADAKTGHVPVLVRFPNPEERVRCGVNVSVRFTGQQTVCNGRISGKDHVLGRPAARHGPVSCFILHPYPSSSSFILPPLHLPASAPVQSAPQLAGFYQRVAHAWGEISLE